MKVVINKCYGGFSISPAAVLWLFERGYDGEGFKTPVDDYFGDGRFLKKEQELNKWREYLKTPTKDRRDSLFLCVFSPDEKHVLGERDIERHNPLLIECVEALGEKADGACAKLRVVDIPDGTDYVINEYDGMERVEETHRSWG